MFPISLLVASMLLKLIATTTIFHSFDQIASVGENTIMKSGHQHTKRMQYAKKTPSDICACCGKGLDKYIYECSSCKLFFHHGCLVKDWRGVERCPTCRIFRNHPAAGKPTVQLIVQNESEGRKATSSGHFPFVVICKNPGCSSPEYFELIPGTNSYACGKCGHIAP
ncbi:hypothetical protein PGT21_011552 [Puccinia graminis f. sp. tritici]|uniref:RING-type domain-containing protein n=1 Tax=Puccinia graminis f. sp. tritici TaxID=56615 RepID=A0A5B0NYV4_PUCGR|nr:hypothetical protein PGT21_011552 [Puccinia graminis f. sp. tritici]